jgi:TrmH family RNA methyltransferase
MNYLTTETRVETLGLGCFFITERQEKTMDESVMEIDRITKENINEIRLKPYKKEFPYSYSCGVFPSCELTENKPQTLLKLILTEKSLENAGVKKMITAAEKLGVTVSVDDKTAARIYPKENVYAIGVFKKYDSALDPSKNHLALVNPSDMGNLGTIIRTMVAFEIYDLAIITPAADVFDPKAIRASMGAFFRLRCARFDSFDEYLTKACGENREFYPFMLNGVPMENVPPCDQDNFSLIFGNEARGLPEEFEKIGKPVRIDHANTVDSLNLTIAAAIGIYNFVKGNEKNG